MEDHHLSCKRPPPCRSSTKLLYHHIISYLIPFVVVLPLAGLVVYHVDFLAWRLAMEVWGRLAVVVVLGMGAHLLVVRPQPVHLVNFSCCKPAAPGALSFSGEKFMSVAKGLGFFTRESMEFQKKILERSGIGNATYFPASVCALPPRINMVAAREEVQMVMFAAVDDLVAKTGLDCRREVGVLVVNCSMFGPTPSLAEMIVNRYRLREDVMCFNLTGMGCSAGLIAVDLVRNLLRVHRNTSALVVSTETLSLHGYQGNSRAMLVPNCLFRVGGAAVLLSNRRSDRRRAKYRLSECVRTHKGSSDECFACVAYEEDEEGKEGISLSKDLMNVAGEALKANITTLGPRVLPLSEQLIFLASLVGRKVLKMKRPPYIPDFKTAFDHFCIHAGGRALLDAIEKSLSLAPWHMEPSRMTLYRFGNTSSSSLWYELAYSEAKGRIRRGDRVWQLAFGSGFKCNSVVWKALRSVDPKKEVLPWLEEIHQFPVPVPKVMPIDA